MAEGPDQAAHLARQYADGSRLAARGALRARFRTNPHTWSAWLFDHLRIAPDARILDVGCGLAWLWRANRRRIPVGWDVTLTDFSPGMLREAQAGLCEAAHPFRFAVADVQALPFPDGAFDAVVANHMLYHVPDRPRALAEIRRVLAPVGRLYASTIGAGHLRELAELAPDRWGDINRRFTFTLESGGAQLAPLFARVALYRHDDTLVVTEAEAIIGYLESLSDRPLPEEAARRVWDRVASEGAIRLSTDAGLFEAW